MIRIYTMEDTERNILAPPFCAEDEIVAKRIFIKSLAKSPFWKSCKLIWLGEYDETALDGPIKTGIPKEIEVTEDEMLAYWDEDDKLTKRV